MQFLRHSDTDQKTSATGTWQERDALARAEYLCDQAQVLHQEAAARSEEIVAQAKSDAARLLREALAVIDANVARSEAARRQEEMDQMAAQAARMEAERLLDQARQMQARMAAVPADEEPAVLEPAVLEPAVLEPAVHSVAGSMFDLRELADLSR